MGVEGWPARPLNTMALFPAVCRRRVWWEAQLELSGGRVSDTQPLPAFASFTVGHMDVHASGAMMHSLLASPCLPSPYSVSISTDSTYPTPGPTRLSGQWSHQEGGRGPGLRSSAGAAAGRGPAHPCLGCTCGGSAAPQPLGAHGFLRMMTPSCMHAACDVTAVAFVHALLHLAYPLTSPQAVHGSHAFACMHACAAAAPAAQAHQPPGLLGLPGWPWQAW